MPTRLLTLAALLIAPVFAQPRPLTNLSAAASTVTLETSTTTTRQMTSLLFSFDAPNDPQLGGVWFQVHSSLCSVPDVHHAMPVSLAGGHYTMRVPYLPGLHVVTVSARTVDLDGNVAPVTDDTQIEIVVDNRKHQAK